MEFPIAHDPDWTLWQHYGIEAWPTVVLIDGEGNIRERWVGDGQVRELDAAVTSLNNAIVPRSRNAPPPDLRSLREPMLPPRFPVGIAVDPHQLYVPHRGPHPILACHPGGPVPRQFRTSGAGATPRPP